MGNSEAAAVIKAGQACRPDRILCVDDNEAARYARGRLLRADGFEVVEAASGAEALALARSSRPALILLDIRLPDINGFAVCRRLKSDPRTAAIPVLHISSLGQLEHDYPEALESGADAYLRDPVDPAVLAAVIRALIRAASAEAQARESERKAVDIVESVGEAMYLLDAEFRFTYFNAAAEALLGSKRDDVIGRSLQEVFPPVAGSLLETEIRRVMATREPSTFENYYAPWSRWYEVNARPVGGGGVAVHFREITRRKQADEERLRLVRELNERTGELQALLDSVPVAIWIAHDPECRVITGNAYADQVVMHAPREGNISRSAPEGEASVSYKVFRGGLELRPEELPAQVAAATGQPVPHQPCDLVFADGRTISLLLGAVPLFDNQGRVRGSLVAGSDITQIRRAEEELRREREHLESTALFPEQNPSPVLRIGADGVLLYANPSSKALTDEWGCATGGIVPDLVRCAVAGALECGLPVEIETLAGGRTFSFVVAPIAGSSHANLYGRDITDRKRLEEQLRDRIEEMEKVMEVVPAAIWVAHDPQCAQITGNAMADRFYEAGPGENVSANLSAVRRFFQGGRELEPWELPMQQAAAQNVEIRDSELEVQLPSGRRIYMLGHASPLRDAAGQVRGCVGAFLDITQRTHTERELRDSEERYRTLFTSMTEGFAVGEPVLDCGIPVDFRFLEINEAFERLSGLDRRILGRPMREVLPNLERVWIDHYGRVALTGEPIHFDEYNRDTNRYYRVFAYSPSPGRFAILFSDITELKRTEQALRESEHQFRIMGETVPYGVWLCDPEGDVIYTSQSFCDLLGMTLEEQRQFGWTRRLVPEDVDPMLAKWRRCCATGDPWEHEHRVIGDDGQIVTVLAKGLPVRDSAGRITCWVGVNLDITDRKRAELAMRQSEERFRRLVEVSAQVVWTASAEGELEYSPGWRAFTGLGGEQARGGGWLEAIHPADRARAAAAWREAVRLGRSYAAEYRLMHASGEYRYTQSHAAPLFHADGTVREWIGMTADITDRKRAEQALAEAAQRLEAHMDNSPLAVVEFDPELRVTRWSKEAERIFGWTAAEIMGRSIAQMRWVHENDAETVRHVSREMREGRRPRNVIANRNYRKDGTVIDCEWYNSAIYDSQGRLASVLSQVLDVTSRKRAEERLRQAQKTESIALLAGGVAHDFNNLLVGVIGNASLALDMVSPDHESRELLDRIVRCGEQAAHLTRQMLAYSGKGKFVIERVDLSELVREVTDLVRSTAPKKIAMEIDAPPGLPPIEADRGQIYQVLMNLVINATEAIGNEAGLIAIQTGLREVDDSFVTDLEEWKIRPGPHVFLEVRDTGCGMTEATRQRIFDPFFTTKFTGRGLGLAAVAGIVRGHNGAIHVSSAPGRGTNFLLLFPPMRSASDVHTPVEAVRRTRKLEVDGAVLVVDDEPAVRRMATLSLERQGCEVLAAASGPEALQVLARNVGRVRLVLLDLSMPGMSGREVLPQLLAIDPGLKVIVSSGYAEAETLGLFGDLPVAGFIQKPYTVQRLVDTIGRIPGLGAV